MPIKALGGYSNPTKQDVSGEVSTCMGELEEEVHQWMNSFDAWDERKHPAILQFLSDLNGHCRELHSPGGITVSVVFIELDRLDKKLANPNVSLRIGELKKALLIENAWRNQTSPKPRCPSQSN